MKLVLLLHEPDLNHGQEKGHRIHKYFHHYFQAVGQCQENLVDIQLVPLCCYFRLAHEECTTPVKVYYIYE